MITAKEIKAQNANAISDKIIVKKAVIDAPLERVWWQWSTPEGLRTFFGEENNMSLKVGGPYEIYFSMEAPEGTRGSEGCKVLTYLPQKMLSFSWNVPPSFPEIRAGSYQPWVVVQFSPVDESSTIVTLTHLGFLEGEDWDLIHQYFDSAWDVVMTWLKESNQKTE